MKIIYGRNPIFEAIQKHPDQLEKIFIKHSVRDERIDQIIKECEIHSIPYTFIGPSFFEQYARGRNHQGIVAQTKEMELPFYESVHHFWEEVTPTPPYFFLILDQITDVHNAGAIIRSAAFFNVAGVIVETKNCANLSEVAHKTSSGAVWKIPLIKVSNLSTTIMELKKHLFFLIAASSDQSDTPLPHTLGKDHVRNIGLVLGSEGKGIRKNLLNQVDIRFTIPSKGDMDSLNVSVAAGIFMHTISKSLMHTQPDETPETLLVT